MMKKNTKLSDDADSETRSTNEKEDSKINLPNEEIQSVALSSPTIDNIKGSQPLKPNALTMTKMSKNTENTQIKKTKKFGDGSFIAAEDR
ncbi:MAG: hypothetical protein QOK90_10515 [Nitrososphaeraceae archaeon]|nr:hypothetical protein [Nitrososphaeraceae archaeon]